MKKTSTHSSTLYCIYNCNKRSALQLQITLVKFPRIWKAINHGFRKYWLRVLYMFAEFYLYSWKTHLARFKFSSHTPIPCSNIVQFSKTFQFPREIAIPCNSIKGRNNVFQMIQIEDSFIPSIRHCSLSDSLDDSTKSITLRFSYCRLCLVQRSTLAV